MGKKPKIMNQANRELEFAQKAKDNELVIMLHGNYLETSRDVDLKYFELLKMACTRLRKIVDNAQERHDIGRRVANHAREDVLEIERGISKKIVNAGKKEEKVEKAQFVEETAETLKARQPLDREDQRLRTGMPKLSKEQGLLPRELEWLEYWMDCDNVNHTLKRIWRDCLEQHPDFFELLDPPIVDYQDQLKFCKIAYWDNLMGRIMHIGKTTRENDITFHKYPPIVTQAQLKAAERIDTTAVDTGEY